MRTSKPPYTPRGAPRTKIVAFLTKSKGKPKTQRRGLLHSPQKTKENQKIGRPLLASGFDLAIYIYGTWRPVLRRAFIFDAPVRTLNSDPPLRARTDPCCRPRHPPNFEGGAPGSMAGANVFASARWGVSGSAQFSHIYMRPRSGRGPRGPLPSLRFRASRSNFG